MPLYALDEHTRLGREAIWRFACENDGVRACLERFVPASRRRRAANVAAFYADAAPVARRLMWEQSRSLETFGTERDLLLAGVPAEGIGPLLEAVRANLGHLNELGLRVWAGHGLSQPEWSCLERRHPGPRRRVITRDNFHLSKPISCRPTTSIAVDCNRSLVDHCTDPKVLELITAATAPNTLRAYESDIAHFLAWGGSHSVQSQDRTG